MAQRTAGLSVQSRCHDRAPNLSCRRDHGQTRRHSQAPRGVRWPPSECMPICLRTLQATSPTSISARSERNKCRDRPTTRQPARAALAFEREQGRRESERRKDEAARETWRERRQQATAKAQAALEKAKREHDREQPPSKPSAPLEKRSEAEDTRWEKQKEKLETALRRARD